MALAKFSRIKSSEAGFSLAEVLVATVVMVTGVVSMAGMFVLATRSNNTARNTSFATILAEQKLEQLRSLAWGFDTQNLPVSDTETDTSVSPESATGGTGLAPSPGQALHRNTKGYVDHLDAWGEIVGNDEQPPPGAIFTRRWSIEPLPTNPNNTLILQVLVTRHLNRTTDEGRGVRLMDEARVITVKTRKSQ
jgi:type II secretory pathway pseudopilin PulG